MDLIEQVTADLGSAEKAQAALGAVFTSVRMSMDAKTFGEIRTKYPKVESWMGRALTGGGRTGEMLALVGPEALKRNLKAAGLEPDEMTTLGKKVGEVLKGLLAPPQYEQLETRVPLLKG